MKAKSIVLSIVTFLNWIDNVYAAQPKLEL